MKKLFLLFFGFVGVFSPRVWCEDSLSVKKNEVTSLAEAFEKKDWNRCLSEAQSITKDSSDIAEYALVLQASCQSQLQMWPELNSSLKKLEEASLNYFLDKIVLKARLNYELTVGNNKEALKTYSVLSRRMARDPEWPDLLYTRAELHLKMKDMRRACADIMTLFVDHPEHSSMLNLHPDLAKNEIFKQKLNCRVTYKDMRDRVKSVYWSLGAARAQADLEKLQGSISSYDSDRLQAYLWTLTGDIKMAHDLLKKYFAARAQDVEFLSFFAMVSSRLGQGSLAVSLYEKLARLETNRSKKTQAEFFVAFTAYQFRDYDGAQRRLLNFIKKHPRAPQVKEANWLLAWVAYLKGRFDTSQKLFAQIESKTKSGIEYNRARYWRARSLIQMQQLEEGISLLRELSQDEGYGYYSILAKSQLQNLPKVKTTPKVFIPHFVANGWQSKPFSDEWMSRPQSDMEGLSVSDIGSEETETKAPLISVEETSISGREGEELESEVSLLSRPALLAKEKKAKLYQSLNLFEVAKWEFFDIERKSSSKDYLETLLKDYLDIGQYNRASAVAQIHLADKRRELGMQQGRHLWEAAYPQAFAKNVESSAKNFSLSPSFIWSIMRAESLYRKDAISPVGALGLMQVMPETGRNLASLMGDKDFNPRSLLQPEQAILYGGRYLSRLMQNFNQSMPLTAASYNAGPHRAQLWLSLYGNLSGDEFIEHIPFTETRNYVKKVMSNYYIYSKLYEDPKLNLAQFREPFTLMLSGTEVPLKESWNDL